MQQTQQALLRAHEAAHRREEEPGQHRHRQDARASHDDDGDGDGHQERRQPGQKTPDTPEEGASSSGDHDISSSMDVDQNDSPGRQRNTPT